VAIVASLEVAIGEDEEELVERTWLGYSLGEKAEQLEDEVFS